MKDALVQHILRTNNIPGSQAAWAIATSSELGLASANITTNPRHYRRAYLIDTGGWLGTALASGDWNQGPGGETMPPTNSRLMIVSTIARSDVPASINFNETWAWNSVQNPTNKPPSWSSFSGTGDDICIQRINLDPLFHHVILINGALNFGGRGYFSINTNTSSPLPVPVVPSDINSYYLDGSVLYLYDATRTNTVQEVIRKDLSRVFEYGLWRDQINRGTTTNVLSGLSAIAATFYTYPPPGGWTNNLNPGGGTPQAVFGLLNSFMNGYATWAAQCFGYSGTNIATYPPYEEIHDALNAFGAGQGGRLVP
jgi:hypothetical protein